MHNFHERCRKFLLVKLVMEDVTSHLLYGLINVTATGVFSEMIVLKSGIFCSCHPKSFSDQICNNSDLYIWVFFFICRGISSLNLTKEYSDITHTPQNPPLIKLIVCIITLIALKIVHFHNVLYFRLRKLMHAV